MQITLLFVVQSIRSETKSLESGKLKKAFAVAAMAGDVNLFLNDPEDPSTAEIEVMIAEEKW